MDRSCLLYGAGWRNNQYVKSHWNLHWTYWRYMDSSSVCSKTRTRESRGAETTHPYFILPINAFMSKVCTITPFRNLTKGSTRTRTHHIRFKANSEGLSYTTEMQETAGEREPWVTRSRAWCFTPRTSDRGSITAVWSDPAAQKIKSLHLSSEIPLLLEGEHVQQRHERSMAAPAQPRVLLVTKTKRCKSHSSSHRALIYYTIYHVSPGILVQRWLTLYLAIKCPITREQYFESISDFKPWKFYSLNRFILHANYFLCEKER